MTVLVGVSGGHHFLWFKLPMAKPNAKPALKIVSVKPITKSMFSTIDIQSALLSYSPLRRVDFYKRRV